MDNLDRLKSRLEYFLNMTEVLSDGTVVERRFLVASVNNLRIEIRPNEHPPPHFHVKSDEINASFGIIDCKFLKGEINSKDRRRIERFHKESIDLLIETWNKLRPTNCPVGIIKIDT
ncbi:MAG: DUF4160 domain-containing protein [Bacteroidetes bacterium]|nr:DUF4160 domain-containing protein [Bacteroidota bacterium]